jgi:Uma2 family endonuclease
MTALPKKDYLVTPEEYLEGEKRSEMRHEYLGGVVYAMAGASRIHNALSSKIQNWLAAALHGKPCQSYIHDVKIRIPKGGDLSFYYPDVFVACDPRDTDEYFCDYPSVVFEVLSPQTARFDWREKRWAYQTIETLQTYVLVDQFKTEVTVWQRGEADYKVYTKLEDVVPLPSLGLSLSLATIYDGIELPKDRVAPWYEWHGP